MLFFKSSSSLNTPRGNVVRPPQVMYLDYEVEMGFVIKKSITKGVQVGVDNIHEYVGGIILVQDFSARDIQLPQEQWTKGKSFRTFGPFGPYLYLITNETSQYLDNIQVQLYVNGEKRQDSNSRYLLHKPYNTLTEVSHIMDLHPGDVIMTGSPGGSILGYRKPPLKIIQRIAQFLFGDQFWKFCMKIVFKNRPWLKEGDVVTACGFSEDGEVQLGVMRNEIISANRSEWFDTQVPYGELGYHFMEIVTGVFVIGALIGVSVIFGVFVG